MNNNKKQPSVSSNIPDSDTSDDDPIPDYLKTTPEEREGTVPYSPQADAAAYATGTAQGNPTVPRGIPRRQRRKPKVPTTTVAVQTNTITTPPVSPIKKESETTVQPHTGQSSSKQQPSHAS